MVAVFDLSLKHKAPHTKIHSDKYHSGSQKYIEDRLLIPRQFNPLVEVSALRLQKLVKSKNRFMRLGQSSAFAKRRVSDDSAPTPFAGTASASEPRGWGLGGHSPMQRGSSLGSLASLFGPSSQR